jgi:hypothetical protein
MIIYGPADLLIPIAVYFMLALVFIISFSLYLMETQIGKKFVKRLFLKDLNKVYRT